MSSALRILVQKRILGLFSIALVTFCATVLVSAPATLLIPAIKRTAPDLAYTNIDGTIWNTTIKHLTVKGTAIGDVDLKLNFTALLKGSLDYAIAFDDEAIRGTLSVKRHLFGKIEVYSNSLEIGQSVISRLALLGVRLDGTMTFSNAQIVLNKDSCIYSDGTVETNLLRAPAKHFGVTSPDLAGNVVCNGGKLGIVLSGTEPSLGRVSLDLFSLPPNHLSLKARLSPKDAAFVQVLKISGFEEIGNAVQFEQIVPL